MAWETRLAHVSTLRSLGRAAGPWCCNPGCCHL